MSLETITTNFNEENETIVSLPIWSNLLFGITIDTHYAFSQDVWYSQELDSIHEGDTYEKTVEFNDFQWQTGAKEVVHGLAAESIRVILSQLQDDGIIVDLKLNAVDMNRPPNTYEGQWSLNMSKLNNFLNAMNWDIDAYVTEHHSSRDGFISSIPIWLESEEDGEFAVILMKLDAYLRDSLDQEDYLLSLTAEADDLYSRNTSYTYIGE